MSDHSKILAEQAWAEHDHLVHDLQNIDDVLAQHEQKRMDDFIDACTDLFDDGDDE